MEKVERCTYFMANLEDKPGALLTIMQELKHKNINLAGLWGFGTHGGKAQLFVVAQNSDLLRSLWKASGLLAEEGTGFFITGSDRLGALSKYLEALANSGVNIHAIDAIAISGEFGSFVWVAAADVSKASTALGLK